jgi:hypothetical protein
MADDGPPTFTIRKRTVAWVTVGVVVLTALGLVLAVGLSPGPSTHKIQRIVVSLAPGHNPATTPTPSTTAEPVPEVESCTNKVGDIELRPTSIGFGCAGLDTTVTAITWAVWAPTDAVGVGTFNQDTCVPDCATGNHNTYRVDVVLNKPGDYLGSLVFQNVTVTSVNGGTPVENTGDPGSAWGTG